MVMKFRFISQIVILFGSCIASVFIADDMLLTVGLFLGLSFLFIVYNRNNPL